MWQRAGQVCYLGPSRAVTRLHPDPRRTQAAQAMKGGGMDFSALAQQMGATRGGAGAGGAAAEIERFRRRNQPVTGPSP